MTINDLLANPAVHLEQLSISNFGLANVVVLVLGLLVIVANVVLSVYRYRNLPKQ